MSQRMVAAEIHIYTSVNFWVSFSLTARKGDLMIQNRTDGHLKTLRPIIFSQNLGMIDSVSYFLRFKTTDKMFLLLGFVTFSISGRTI